MILILFVEVNRESLSGKLVIDYNTIVMLSQAPKHCIIVEKIHLHESVGVRIIIHTPCISQHYA